MDEFSPEFFDVLRKLAPHLRACADAFNELSVCLEKLTCLPSGTEPIPALLNPGDSILNEQAMRWIGADKWGGEYSGGGLDLALDPPDEVDSGTKNPHLDKQR